MVMDYRQKANRVLGLVFGIFVVAAVLKDHFPHSLALRIFYIVFEAALIGGIADWFAVTALFRRPLGFPWHTALIPNNRDKLIAAIAAAVQNELLSKEAVKRRLAAARLVDFIGNWLNNQDRQIMFQNIVTRYAQQALVGVDPRAVAQYGQRLLKYYLRETAMADKMQQVLQWALLSGRAEQAVDYILAELSRLASRDGTRETIQHYLESYRDNLSRTWWQKLVLDIAEMTDTLNLAEAAAVLHGELEQFLQGLVNLDHPVRRWIQSRLVVIANNLGNEPAWQKSVSEWQQGLANRINLLETLAALTALALESAGPAGAATWIGRQLGKLWEGISADQVLQDWLEDRLQTALGDLIDIEQNLVATVVKEALQRLSDEDLNRFIEDKAGEDLGWIRINGSVVGGVVGLFLYLFLHYFYGPIVLPLLKAWL